MIPLRWRFPDESEADARAQVTNRIDAWWRAFEKKAPEIDAMFSGGPKFDLPAWTIEHLEAIGPGIRWEYGPGVKTKHRLVITCESQLWARPLVNEILRRAPRVEGFELYGHRLVDPSGAELVVEARTGVKLSDLTVDVKPCEYGVVELQFFADEDDDAHQEAAFIAAEYLLGEDVLATWVGPLGLQRGRGGPLSALKPAVDAHIEARRASLPDRPQVELDDDSGTGAVLKLQPSEADDYVEQRDLLVGTSSDVEQFKAARVGIPFDSRRHSRCGETFAYLKTDGSQGLPADGFADKAEIEDALDEVLVPAKLGRYIGGGTGLRYSYVDLALTDVDRAIPLIVERMRAGKLPKRSWIQFFDSDLKWEWIGIWPDSPPPPLPEIDA